MAVKLVFALTIFVIVIAIVTAAAFLYFKRRAELKAELKEKEMEQTEKLFDE